METALQVLTPQDVGRANRYRVLQALVDHGPLSRAELARVMGVPRASVGTITNTLVEDGVLAEEPAPGAQRGRGKPARPLWFADDAGLCGAVAIESGRVRCGLVDASGAVSHAAEVAIDETASEEQLIAAVTSMFEAFSVAARQRIRTVGLTVPAQCDPAGRVIELCTVVPALTNSALPERLAEIFGCEVALEQDVRAFASAERWFGNGRGRVSFGVLQVDRGVGVGLVVDGHLFPGVTVSSPQFGHICVDRSGLDCSCGQRGCWETIASTEWLATAIANMQLERTDATLGTLLQCAEEGDAAAADLIEEYADNIAIGIATLGQIFRVPHVVLEGELSHAGEAMRVRLQRATNRRAAMMAHPPEILRSGLLHEAALLGAGATALSQELGVRL